jgi:tetratricopeptide (TPR) repeat protein
LSEAFGRFGIVLGTTSPDEIARRLTDSPIRDRVLTGLDRWLLPSRSPNLLAVLRVLDPDPFRDSVRAAIAAKDNVRIGELAGRPAALDQPPRFAAVLGSLYPVAVGRRNRLLLAALGRRPSEFDLLMTLGNLYPVNTPEKADEREKWFRAALALRPRNVAVWNHLGSALGDKGDLDGAVACFREAVGLDSTFAISHYNLSQTLRMKGDMDGVIASCREVIRIDPKYPNAHYTLGVALLSKKDVDGAIGAFRAATGVDPTDASAHYNLGRALQAKGDLDGAVGAYRESIGIDPRYALARNDLGLALRAKGDLDGAVAAFEAAVKIDPVYRGYRNNLNDTRALKAERDARTAPPPREVKRP